MAGSFDLSIITDRLPFGIDDAKAVNALYVQFIDDPSPEREQLVEAWTYGYICKYMAAKHAKGSIRHASDIEMLIGKTYERVRKGLFRKEYSWLLRCQCVDCSVPFSNDRLLFTSVRFVCLSCATYFAASPQAAFLYSSW